MNIGADTSWAPPHGSTSWLLRIAFAALLVSGCRGRQPAFEEARRNPAIEGVYRATDGGIVALRPPSDGLTVVFFYSRECPISNFYIPVLNELVRRHGTDRIRWIGACVDPDISLEEQLRHSREYAIGFPTIADRGGTLAAAVGATITPEVAVFGSDGQLLYRGRIDDHYAARGVKAAAAENHELDEAVAAGLAGRVPKRRETEAVGCPLPEVTPSGETRITYAEHIAPLIYRRCLACHRQGSTAPFPLETFQHARRRADDLADVTASRFMPPSRIDPNFGQRIEHDLTLSDDEIRLFAAWAANGAEEGDSSTMPKPPLFREGWQLGEPDVVLEMPDACDVPASGPDMYRCFVIPTDFGTDRFVTSVEYRPGVPAAVHHILSYVDTSGAAKKLDSRDPGPGYDCFGSPGIAVTGEMGAWGPGMEPEQLPNGMARFLPRNADIVLQIHYHPTGKAETDRTRIGLRFAKVPPEQVYLWFPVQNSSFRIPANASSHEVVASKLIPFDLVACTVLSHMHLLGRDMEVWLERPSGERVDLLRVAPWDFKWQRSYRLADPVKIPAGSRLFARPHYDNSTENPSNPNRTHPVEVSYGERTIDEMCVVMIGAVRADGYSTAAHAGESIKTLWGQEDDSEWNIFSSADAGKTSLKRLTTGWRVELSSGTARSERWNVQVKHPFKVREGMAYKISARLKADAPRQIRCGVLQNHPPYQHLGASEDITLGPTWQTFRTSFVADRDEPDAMFVIAAGASDVSFEIGKTTVDANARELPEDDTETSPVIAK